MDKEEYRQKLEELNGYVRDKDYEDALAVVEQVDWRRVKSINTLNMVADVYEVNKEYEKAKNILVFAHNRSSIGRGILYRLVDISLKIDDIDDAERYFKEFSKVAKNDNSRCILQYKLYKAKEAPIEAQIDVLEEYRDREYTEQWAYELAKLYAKAGDTGKCVDACDDLILWFSEGQYVLKALELKKKYEALSPLQETTYNRLRAAYRKPRTELLVDPAAGETAGEEEAVHSQVEADAAARADMFAARLAKEAAAVKAKEAAESAAKAAAELETGIASKPEAEKAAEDEGSEEVQKPAVNAGDFRERLAKSFRSVFGVEDEDDEEEDETFYVDQPKTKEADEAEQKDEILPEISVPAAAEEAEEILPEEADLAEAAAEKMEDAEDIVFEELPAAEDTVKKRPEPEFRTVAPPAQETAPKKTFHEEVYDPADFEVLPEEEAEELPEVKDIEEELPAAKDAVKAEEPKAEKAASTGEFDLEAFLAETAGAFSTEISEESYSKPAPVSEEKGLADFSEIDVAAAVAKAAALQSETKGVISSSPAEAIAGIAVATEASAEAAAPAAPTPARKPKYNEELEIPDPEPTAQERRTHTIPFHTIGQNTVPISIDKILSQETPEERRIRILNKAKPSMMSEEQREIFTYFARIPGMDMQILDAMNSVYQHAGEKTSLHGNIAVMGAAGTGKSRLCHGLVVAMCRDLGIEAAKIAKVTGSELNKKDVVRSVARMSGGFLLIEEASKMTSETVDLLNQAMEYRTDCMIVIIEDEKSEMRAFLKGYPQFAGKFDKVISIPVFTNDELVTFARIYATENGCKIDDMAILALYTMIGNIQTEDVPVTISSVKEMIDNAIAHATKGRRRKRADAKTIVLQEKDFTQN
ncbi:MAG: hypothetical protein Q4B22_05135 [Eubacteriales bacterium]|nr:hypothetical protein [Eubacteriales bacterium]